MNGEKQIADLRKQRDQYLKTKKLMEETFAELVVCFVNKFLYQNKSKHLAKTTTLATQIKQLNKQLLKKKLFFILLKNN